MTTNSELDETFELTEEQEFQLWKESVEADIAAVWTEWKLRCYGGRIED